MKKAKKLFVVAICLPLLMALISLGIAQASFLEYLSYDEGIVSINHNWTTVTFEESFSNVPVVFPSIQTENGGHDCEPEIRNLTETGYQIRIEEDRGLDRSWLDGWHTYEDVSWVAFDPAEFMSGYGVEAGVVSFKQASHSYWESVDFGENFDEAPFVFVQTQTRNGGHTESPDVQNVTANGFELRIEEDPGNGTSGGWDGWHTPEDMGYWAVSRSADLSDDGILVDSVDVTNSWETVCFKEDCSEAYTELPSVILGIQTENEADTVQTDLRNVTTSGFDVRLEEFDLAGWDGVHVAVEVAWLAYGVLVAEPEPDPEPEYDPSEYDVLVIDTSSTSSDVAARDLLEGLGYNVDFLPADTVDSGISTDYELLVWPGGESPVYDAMESAKRTAVQDFVNQGGGFIGVCGGGIAGAEKVHLIDYYGINIDMFGIGDNITAHYDTGWMSYIGGSYNPDVKVETTHPILGDHEVGDKFSMAYRGGPVFEVGAGVTVLLSYTETFSSSYAAKDQPAAVARDYGEGKVVLFALHPEFMTSTEDMFARAAQWANGGF